jgi:mannose-6-phosphate isomerase-like protein (cupin superfamily)
MAPRECPSFSSLVKASHRDIGTVSRFDPTESEGRYVMNKPRSRIDKPTLIPPGHGESYDFGGFGVHWKIDGQETGGRFSIIHHPIAPRTLAAPLHYHHDEDEFSFVLEGTMGALLGEEVVEAGPGVWVFKPRQQWHTFWNAGDTPCLIIEVISPAGLENAFREYIDVGEDMDRMKELDARYAVDTDYASVTELCDRFGLIPSGV